MVDCACPHLASIPWLASKGKTTWQGCIAYPGTVARRPCVLHVGQRSPRFAGGTQVCADRNVTLYEVCSTVLVAGGACSLLAFGSLWPEPLTTCLCHYAGGYQCFQRDLDLQHRRHSTQQHGPHHRR